MINFPTSNQAQFISGPEYFYFSPDGNFFFGGSPTGWDMIAGVNNAGAAAFGGLYYEAGVDEDFSTVNNTSTCSFREFDFLAPIALPKPFGPSRGH